MHHCMLSIYTRYGCMMHIVYVIIVLNWQSCCRLMKHHTNDIGYYTIVHVTFVTDDVSIDAELWSIDVLLAHTAYLINLWCTVSCSCYVIGLSCNAAILKQTVWEKFSDTNFEKRNCEFVAIRCTIIHGVHHNCSIII